MKMKKKQLIRKYKKILAFALALLTAFGMIPFSALATGDSSVHVITQEAEHDHCEICGEEACEIHGELPQETEPTEQPEETEEQESSLCEVCNSNPCLCTEYYEINLIGFFNQNAESLIFRDAMGQTKTVTPGECPSYVILTHKRIEKSLDAEGNLVKTVVYQMDSLDDQFYFGVLLQYALTGEESFSKITEAQGLFTTVRQAGRITLYKDLSVYTDAKTVDASLLAGEYTVADICMESYSGQWHVKLVPDENWPEAANGYYWVKAVYVTDLTLTHTRGCEVCGRENCQYIHFWCERCQKYDCGASHIYCAACGTVDCTVQHVWCGYCGKYDCTIKHEDAYAPVQEPEIPENPRLDPEEEVTVVDKNGDPVFVLALEKGKKTSISAWMEAEENATYQWQVRYNNANDLWIDIKGETGKGIFVSPAMFKSLINYQGTTALRCVIEVNGECYTSAVIPVTVLEAVPQSGTMIAPPAGYQGAIGETPAADGVQYSLIIEYKFRDGKPAATSWTANLTEGSDYILDVESPTVLGYKPDQARVTEDIYNFSGTKTITVYYDPDIVNFTVIHHQQDVTGGNYTAYQTETKRGTTGTKVGTDLQTTFAGFDSLRYDESLIIAADGSTVVNIYYDRQYYMLSLDLNGGYGAEPMYVRYGTPVRIEDPLRTGYTFAGWFPALPTMVTERTEHTAQWTKANTSFTVAFWYENANDEKYTFVGSVQQSGTTGAKVNGANYKSVAFDNRDDEHFTYEKADSNVEVKADGSTVVNVYFTRNSYTLTYLKKQCVHVHGNGCTYCSEGKVNHKHTHSECCSSNWIPEWLHAHQYLNCDYGYEHTHSSSCCTHTNTYDCACKNTDAGWSIQYTGTFKYEQDVSAIHAAQGAERWCPGPGSGFSNEAKYGDSLAIGTYSSMHGSNVTFYQGRTGANQYYFTFWLETYDGSGTRTHNGRNFAQSTTFTPRMGAVGYKGDYQAGRPAGFLDFEAWASNGLGGDNVAQLKAPNGSYGSEYTYYNFYYIRDTFTLLYFNGSTQVATETMMFEEPLTDEYNKQDLNLVSPFGDGYYFAGWYLDPEGTVEVSWDSTRMPNGGMAVYAKWLPREYTVKTYRTKGGELLNGSGYVVKYGEVYTGTVPPVYNDPYTFIGWFYELDGEERAYDFSMPVYRDMELYAKWTSDRMGYGTITYIDRATGKVLAEQTPVQGLLGTTKTYDAKIGRELNVTGYFPETPSHSIQFSANENENNFIFYYNAMEAVGYEVRYVNKTTGQPMPGIATKTGTTNEPTLSFRAETIKGYSADAYEKTLIISSDAKLNVITFYYTEDTVHAPVQVIHYIQNTTGSGYTKYLSEQAYQGVIGEIQTAKALTITGFTYNKSGNSVNGVKLTENGLELSLYYDRNTYSYEFRFEDTAGNVLFPTVKGQGLYGSLVEKTADSKPGYQLATAGSLTITITDKAESNIKTFVYAERKANIRYRVGTGGGGTVTPDSEEVLAVTGTAQGATATVSSTDYVFNGWYTDYACTPANKVSGQEHFIPNQTDNGVFEDITYYAKFDEVQVQINYAVKMPTGASVVATLSQTSEMVAIFTGRANGSSVETIPAGYRFAGWYDNAACEGEPLSVQKAYAPSRPEKWVDGTTYYAKFVEKQSTIEYKAVGPGAVSIPVESVDMVTGVAAGATAAADPNYGTFIGWYSDVECTNLLSKELKYVPDKPEGLWEDAYTVYAKFDFREFTITFVDRGQEISKQTYKPGDTLVLPTVANGSYVGTWKVASSEGNNWENEGIVAGSIIEYYGNVTLEVTWTVTVIWIDWDFDLTNWDESKVLDVHVNVPYGTEHDYDGPALSRPADEAYSYTFSTWENALPEAMQDAAKGYVIYRAVYQKTPVPYTITYHLDGGKLPENQTNPETYTVEDEFTLYNPARQGYEFLGWATSAGATSGNKTVTIEKGTTGNQEFYAIWKLALVDLTVKMSSPQTGESYIFTITGTPSNGESFTTIQVILNAENNYQVTIRNLPVGTYEVAEKDEWSWREGAIAAQKILLDQARTLTFACGTVTNVYWLNGYSYNIRKKGGNSNG